SYDVHRQRRQDLAEDGAHRGAVRGLLQDSSRQGRGIRGPHAGLFSRDGLARRTALSPASSRRSADRPSQWAGQADQRAAVRLRGPAKADAGRDLGPLPARVAGSEGSAIRRRPRCRSAQDLVTAPMGLSLTTPPHQRTAAERSPWRRLWLILSLVRYRFFLYAGLLPYLLGAAWAYAMAGVFDAPVFWSGLGGVVLAVVGVESFNEYFDDQMGTDRVFNPDDVPPMASWVLWLGITAFAVAFAVGGYLAYRGGGPILAFAVLGGLAAIFYVAPPIRWAYRGLGETVIALSYGPWMVLGSLYLHTRELSWPALVVSLVPGFLIMALAVVNAIPDYHQDRLVGKRNLVVRLVRYRGVWLYLALSSAG